MTSRNNAVILTAVRRDVRRLKITVVYFQNCYFNRRMSWRSVWYKNERDKKMWSFTIVNGKKKATENPTKKRNFMFRGLAVTGEN